MDSGTNMQMSSRRPPKKGSGVKPFAEAMANGCWKCKRDWPTAVTTVIMIGGYNADLCVDCLNIWHEYIRAKDEYAKYRLAEAMYEFVIYHHKAIRDEIETVVDQRLKLADILYELAKEWMAIKVGVKRG